MINLQQIPTDTCTTEEVHWKYLEMYTTNVTFTEINNKIPATSEVALHLNTEIHCGNIGSIDERTINDNDKEHHIQKIPIVVMSEESQVYYGPQNREEDMMEKSMRNDPDDTTPPAATITANDDEEEEDDDDDDDRMSDSSDVSNLSGLSDLSGHNWIPFSKPITWLQDRISCGVGLRELLTEVLGSGTAISPNVNNASIWRMLVSVLTDPPRRKKLYHINTVDDVVKLLKTSSKIIVLTGAGVSVSCGIPDFRSINGIYSRLSKEFPDLPDPQAMFDIQYFSKDPRPFYKFAREIYPGQFTPSACHRFIKFLEKKKKLLRNYTQNIDTLERIAGIENVIECHGSFATASCTKCSYKVTADTIRDDIFSQRIPLCPICQPNGEQSFNTDDNFSNLNMKPICYSELVKNGIMKPDIVFFGEGLPDSFHTAMSKDKDECDLLIVIGSSLKVRPVALIPSSIPSHVPQILINREQLGHLEFDVELLGDSDVIINQLCHKLDNDWTRLCYDDRILTESNQFKMTPQPQPQSTAITPASNIIQSDENSISNSGFCDSGFENSSSSSANNVNDKHHMLSYQNHNSSDDCSSPEKNQFSNNSTSSSSSSSSNSDNCNSSHLERKRKHTISSSESDDNDMTNFFNNNQTQHNNSRTAYSSCSDTSAGDNGTTSNIPLTKTYNSNNNDMMNDHDKNDSLVNIADRLHENTYFKALDTGVYIFPGAQVYCRLSQTLDDEDDNDNDNDDDDEDDEDYGIDVKDFQSSSPDSAYPNGDSDSGAPGDYDKHKIDTDSSSSSSSSSSASSASSSSSSLLSPPVHKRRRV